MLFPETPISADHKHLRSLLRPLWRLLLRQTQQLTVLSQQEVLF